MQQPPSIAAQARALTLMARPSQLALIALVMLAGVLLGAWRAATPPSAEALVWGAALLLAAAVATHWANEAADAATDAISTRTPFSGGSGALLMSGLAPSLPLALALTLAAATVATTLAAAALGLVPPAAAVLLLIGLGGGLAYSLPPFEAMRHGWGEVLNALLGGLMLPLYGVALVVGAVAATDVLAFLPFMLVVLASVMATAWPDRAADAATGKRTLQVRWGPERLRRLHAGVSVAWAAAVALAVATDASPFAAAGWLVAPLVVLGHRWYTRDRSPWPSVAAMVGHVGVITAGLAVALA
jgi:1,4-dihydroxy-2-naphthoate octaprenyltransferase